MRRTTLSERISTPEFKAGVARHRAKLDAEEAGWVVLDPKTHRALLAVARQARRECGCGPDDGCTMYRALARLDRLSRPQRAGRGR